MNTLNRPQTNFSHILANVSQYYSGTLAKHGATAQGVDWNSAESQLLRFQQLLKICNPTDTFSINDYGCGYGALAGYLLEQGYSFQYRGFDISGPMIGQAQALYKELSCCEFFTDASCLKVADYTIASGIFNVKLGSSDAEWQAYILHTLNHMAELSQKGFAFNVLTSYSDIDRRRSDLYYADPLFFFDYCKKNFSRFVSLLHDYPLYEFTLLVKR